MTNVQALFPETKPATRFDELWAMWPNKAKKPVARAKYEAIVSGTLSTRTLDKDSGQFIELELSATEEEVLSGAKQYIASQIDKRTFRFFDEGRFIPYLSTWLNGGRWEDWL